MDNHHVHTIRLSAAWEPPAAASQPWVRRFGRPTGVGPGDRVVIVIERPAVTGATLNGMPLPPPVTGSARWEYDVTSLLSDRNELALTPAATPGAETAGGDATRAALPARYGAVRLEILTPPPVDR